METYKPDATHDTQALVLLTNRLVFELLGFLHRSGLMSLDQVEQLIRQSVDEVNFADQDHAAAVEFFGKVMINNIPRD